MGGGNWSNDAYSSLRNSYTNKSVDQIFSSKKLAQNMNPYGVKFREARDSDDHPNSLAVMIWLDVTGSMGRIPEVLIREKLSGVMSTLVNHNVSDASVFFGAIGDHLADSAPLQVGQFESDTNKLVDCLTSTFLEGGGGGQNKESYLLAWLFAGRHTSIDCFEKRGEKGVLFTIGDEASWTEVSGNKLSVIMGYDLSNRLKEIIGLSESQAITDVQVLEEAQRLYHVFHIHVNEGSYRDNPAILGYWRNILKERLIVLNDYTKIAEVIATTVAMIHGVDLETIASSFDSSTAMSVKTALMGINTDARISKREPGVFKL